MSLSRAPMGVLEHPQGSASQRRAPRGCGEGPCRTGGKGRRARACGLRRRHWFRPHRQRSEPRSQRALRSGRDVRASGTGRGAVDGGIEPGDRHDRHRGGPTVGTAIGGGVDVIRVMVVDDNAVIRSGVKSLLESTDGLEVVGEASTGKEAIERASELKPDVVLCDVRMPVMDGVEAAAKLSRSAKVLMLTYAEEEHLVTGAIKAGASGYLVHGRFQPDELERAVEDVMADKSVLSPAVVTMVFDALRKDPEKTKEGPRSLTEREMEIATLLARGI